MHIEGLLYNTHKNIADKFSSHHQSEFEDNVNVEAKRFFKLVEDGKQEVYPGCKAFSKLSFIIRLYLSKCVHGLTNVALIIQELIPEAKMPKSFNEAMKLVNDLGLQYQQIDACRNDCMLFWKENKDATTCNICHTSRWKTTDIEPTSDDNHPFSDTRRIPAKVLWHFPLGPRLQRMYMCSEMANYMRWHDEKRKKDGNLRHPADGKTWKNFDTLYPDFANEPRNVRVGLASDGFNPFRTMSTTHSTWPIVLVNYNLPPWLFMKSEYLIMSLIILGPSSPGNDIDIYLQPLMDELKDLWECGAETCDVSKRHTFQMHVALQSTTSDFTGYAMLSGWSKGKYACPLCHYETEHLYLNNSRKSCYMGHRKVLEANHPWREDKKSFNGETEKREAPKPLTGTEVLYLLKDFKNKFGKMQPKMRIDECQWRKKLCFFTLPYWEYLSSRHHLDPMHIENNITNSVIGTLLDMHGKTKDYYMAPLDMKEMRIRSSLHPVESDSRSRYFLPKACFSMTKTEKTMFCEVLQKEKLPQGCASYIGRCVQMKELKRSGYKSHDAHIMMQYLLQVAVWKTLPKDVALALIRLGASFKAICSKLINPQDLGHLQDETVEVLRIFEKIFPSSFFDIMPHLPIHLVEDVRSSGPISSWWMFFVERYLGKLKSYVQNRSRPKGTIAEGYLAEECLVFCSRYLHDREKK